MRTIIVNPASGGGRTAKRWERIVARLGAGGEAFDVQLTSAPGDAIRIARRAVEAGSSGLVVLGGDGTVSEVVAGCINPDGSGPVRTGIELSIVHQGTGGDLARGLAIPKDEAGAIDVALRGASRQIDVGVAQFVSPDGNPAVRAFVSTANVGIAADVVQRATGALKRLGKEASFAIATVACLARNHARVVQLRTPDLDERLAIVNVDVCNNAWMGGGMHVAPNAVIDDGQLDVVVISAAGRTRLIRTFPKIYSGRHVHDPLVRSIRTSELDVGVPDGAEPHGVVLDGELVGQTPATFRVLASALVVRASC